MSTAAEQIVATGRVPKALRKASESVMLAAADGFDKLDAAPPGDPIHVVAKNHGLHAYRYEEQLDGSVVALYVNDRDGVVKMKAFNNMAQASEWTPRDERPEL